MGRKNKSKRKDSTTSESHDETTPIGTTEPPAAPAPSPTNIEAPTAPVTTAPAETNTPSTAPETNTPSIAPETNTPSPSTTPEANPAPTVTSPIVAAATGAAAPTETEARPADDAAPGLLRRIIRWIPIVGRYV
jgi:hypothetical protein